MVTNPLASMEINIYGPLYLATVLSTGLYGVSCMQTFFYYIHYPNDSFRMKCFVATLWMLDTIHKALTVAGVYKFIIAGLTNPLAILHENPELALQILSETVVAEPVQAFFVYRIYIFSGKNVMLPVLWVLQAIFQIVCSLLYVAKALYSVDGHVRIIGTIELNDGFFTGLATSSLACSVAVDVVIAVAMTYLLFKKRSAAGFTNTAHVLQRLAMFAVNTGIWTATFSVASLILMRALPLTLFHTIFDISLSSLYCNTLLANLNARAYIRGEPMAHDGSTSDVAMMNLSLTSNSRSGGQGREGKFTSPALQAIRVNMAVETLVDSDQLTIAENNV